MPARKIWYKLLMALMALSWPMMSSDSFSSNSSTRRLFRSGSSKMGCAGLNWPCDVLSWLSIVAIMISSASKRSRSSYSKVYEPPLFCLEDPCAKRALPNRGYVVCDPLSPPTGVVPNIANSEQAGDDVDRFDLHHFSRHIALLRLC